MRLEETRDDGKTYDVLIRGPTLCFFEGGGRTGVLALLLLALLAVSDGARLRRTDGVGDAVPSISSRALFTAERVDRVETPEGGGGVDTAPDLPALRVLLPDAGVSESALPSLALATLWALPLAAGPSSVLTAAAAAPLEGRFFCFFFFVGSPPFGASGSSTERMRDVFTGRLGNKGATRPGMSRDSRPAGISSGPAP